MNTKGLLTAAAVLLLLNLGASSAHAQLENLQITEVLFNALGNDQTKFEWVEVRNTGSSDIDLDGYTFRDFGNFVPSSALPIPPNIVSTSSGGDSSNTVVPGTASGNSVAVLYSGFNYDYDDDRFRAGWNLPSTVPLIAVDFFPSLNNSGTARQVGLWETIADWEADSPTNEDDNRITESFDNAKLSLNYTTEAGFPGSVTDGHSITWTGNGDINDGSNWIVSEDGVNGASTSVDTILSDGARINGEDFASPNVVPAGTPAPGLLITEVMIDPGEGPGQGGGAGNNDFEWIEVYNNTGSNIDFGATPYIFDDDDDADLEAANVTSGSVANGATAVLFDDGLVTIADMVTMWGPGNYIPVSDWTSLSNGGDTVALWSSLTDYQAEPMTGDGRTVVNAAASVTYEDQVDPWPDTGGGSSLYLTDLGAAGGNNGAALQLLGDFNGDDVVDIADYVVWRNNLGSTDPDVLGGNGEETGGSASLVDADDYLLWKSQFGMSGGAVEPADGSLWLRSSDDFGPPDGPGIAYLSNALTGSVADYRAGDVGSPGFFAAVAPGTLGSAAVPEPGSLALAGLAAIALGLVWRKR
ncbi:lamin tail domain-containing protein [Aeoliella sp. ICT_H6.2]|uniref:Lamin tail domain-containing protein n=1 Tax=Aeoliella straminimaris TaxID=2954799 RepID=A0A9X2FGC2_9BACT|nr:PEP-CTERM sorting domain-containing protein [Aeoliella straminimaris]MCO6047602.1 lamin tail domain-containing protein [Aeoliella straminimaris]